MTTALDRILDHTRSRVQLNKDAHPLNNLEQIIADLPPPRGFIRALTDAQHRGQPAIIAEIKRASPSRGMIRQDFDPSALARAYHGGGAVCLSVLTEPTGFQGSDAHLRDASAAVSLPCLRKDFMLDPYQIAQSRALGADCVLLIVAALTDDLLRTLYDCAVYYGLDALIEVHSVAELDRALALDPHLIGVNARDLKTLNMHPTLHDELIARIPPRCIRVAESGIHDTARLRALQAQGYDAFLIGESLMRAPDPGRALSALLEAAG